jgi:hypothetical protein
MKPRMLSDVIVPLLLMDKTATVCITTLSTVPGNHVTHIIENKLMEHFDISLVCGDCRLIGKEDTCRHLEWLRPNWQTTERYDYVQQLLGPEAFAREAQGILKLDNNTCFNANLIRDVFVNKRFIFSPNDVQRYLFLTIDPCSGSMKDRKKISEFAIMSHVEPGLRITGFDSIPTSNPTSWMYRLVEHLRRCYQIPAFASAKLIVFIEGNMRVS